MIHVDTYRAKSPSGASESYAARRYSLVVEHTTQEIAPLDRPIPDCNATKDLRRNKLVIVATTTDVVLLRNVQVISSQALRDSENLDHPRIQ